MRSLMRTVRRLLGGERRHVPRLNAEHVRYINEQYAVAKKAARKLGTTPDELLRHDARRRALGVEADSYRGRR
jgi:hypothetical protein